MPWKAASKVDERVRFIAAYLERKATQESFTDICERFGISRTLGYRFVERYEGGGAEALTDRSRAPLSHPNAVTSSTVELLVELRRKHPTWGPRKLLVVLKRHHPSLLLPAASTAGEILSKRGLVRRRPDPGDARAVRLEATARGTKLLQAGRRRSARHPLGLGHTSSDSSVLRLASPHSHHCVPSRTSTEHSPQRRLRAGMGITDALVAYDESLTSASFLTRSLHQMYRPPSAAGDYGAL